MTDTRREGRGRLSSIDLLPEDAEAEIIWALEQLRERTMPQVAILDEFNGRLADRGIAKVSKSAFSRWSLRKAMQFRRLDDVRAITADIVSGIGTEGAEEVTIATAEMLKAAVFEQLEGTQDAKSLQALARALNAAVQAQRASADHRKKLEDREAARVSEAVAEKVDQVVEAAREAGLSADVVAQIRREVLGVRS